MIGYLQVGLEIDKGFQIDKVSEKEVTRLDDALCYVDSSISASGVFGSSMATLVKEIMSFGGC